MNIEQMKKRKNDLRLTNEEIAKGSGVPLSTVQKIFSGQTRSPRFDTIMAIEDFLEKDLMPGAVHDSASPEYTADRKKKQGEYTIEDYNRWPEDERIELIDGVIYDMTAPTSIHQITAGWLHYKLLDHVMKNGGDCEPYISPIDIQLDCDDKTMVQPDVIIVCDPSKTRIKNIYGAPDFVCEILSPSTKRKDMTTKLEKYQNAGVREYWIIDTVKERVIVYDFENEDLLKIYTFDDEIPVAIWEGSCRINMKELKNRLIKLGLWKEGIS